MGFLPWPFSHDDNLANRPGQSGDSKEWECALTRTPALTSNHHFGGDG
jgi:hypothetical protein